MINHMKILGGVELVVLAIAALWFVFSVVNEDRGTDDAIIACTQEGKVCPDGTVVGRTGPNCEFAPCPYAGEDVSPDVELGEVANVPAIPDRTVLAQNLEVPWGLAFLPNGRLLITERTGRVVELDPQRGTQTSISVPNVKSTGEGGLLGITLDPAYTTNNYVYLYATEPDGLGTKNRVARYTYINGTFQDETTIIDDIPGARFHDGGRISFGPDGFLYITTGDALDPDIAQDRDSLGGKILRLNPDGSVPGGNPFDSPVYSYGHRNPQGLTWDSAGNLWSTEHGRSGIWSGLDELNRIVAGENYGWPESEGDSVAPGTREPALHSGADVTWAPASAAYYDGSIFFGGLRGETLYEAVLDGTEVVELKEHLIGTYGRIRTIAVGRDGMFYMTTSNTDGRGDVRAGDDVLIRLNPAQFR